MQVGDPTDIKLSVVIVSYNSKDTILECIQPLRELYEKGYLKVVVVDNHGDDGVQTLLASECDWVTVKSAGGNLGFGHGCNLGFKHEPSEYTLFLNPDAVIETESILKLVDFLDSNENIALTAPAIFEGDELQAAGLMPLTVGQRFFFQRLKHEVREINPGQPPFKTNWLCGAVLLVRSSVFEKIGGFDERFFLYFEETDLCRRTSSAGYEIWANGLATAEHIGGASSKNTEVHFIDGCIAEHFYKSRFYFYKKHYSLAVACVNELFEFLQIMFKSLAQLMLGRKSALSAIRNRIQAPFFSEPG